MRAWRNIEPDQCTDEEVEGFKQQWRADHPCTVRLWYDLDRAAQLAVRDPGRVVPCGLLAFKQAGSFLKIKLRSGRKLSYPFPRLIVDDRGQHRVVFSDNSAGQWRDCRFGQGAYGGLWCEMRSGVHAIC